MSGIEQGAIIGVLMLVLLALRVQIGVAMLAAGSIGYMWITGPLPLLNFFKHAAYARYSVYDLSVVPLFLLMGQFATHGGLSRTLFQAGNVMIGHWRGGMAMAGITASAGFGAICGSSLATAATMGQVVMPELLRHKYSPRLSAASLAAGGTLGILIPPSVPLVIYGILTEQNIAKLFMAAIVPGILAAAGYMVAISIVARLHPEDAPRGTKTSLPQKLRALIDTWPALLIFITVIGGIYGGLFTPTEAAAVGVVATALVAWRAGGLRGKGFMECIMGTAKATGMIFLIVLGADVLNVFFALTQLPAELATWVQSLNVSPMVVLFVIIVIYLCLGCVMDSLSMLLLTIPIFYPVISGLDFWGLSHDDKSIWFGILALMVVEIGLITPPVGMNVYVISSMHKETSMHETFKGIVPFLMSDLFRILLLAFVPAVALFAIHV